MMNLAITVEKRAESRHNTPMLLVFWLCSALLILTGCGDDETPIQASLSFVFPTPGSTVTDREDVDPDREGIQLDVIVELTDYSNQGSLSLQVGQSQSSLDILAVDGEGEYTFSAFSVPDGDVQMSLTLIDSAVLVPYRRYR